MKRVVRLLCLAGFALGGESFSAPATSTCCFQSKWPPKRQAAGSLMGAVSPFWNALGTLTFSAASGYLVEKKVPNSGILTTLGIAAVASNTLGSPKTHFLYDVCWSTLLPMSLALLLFSLRNVTGSAEPSDESIRAIKRLAVPFGIVSIGSLLGCFLSFALNFLPRSDSCFAAACLVASYIGGSVNFFATAYTVDKTKTQLASAMATADIFVMAFYFAGLSAALHSPTLKRWFENKQPLSPVLVGGTELRDRAFNEKTVGEPTPKRVVWSAGIVITALSLAFVEMAKRIEAIVNPLVPGTACAFLATSIPAITNRIPATNPVWRCMQRTSKSLSGFVFLFLFAAIGVSVDLEAIIFKEGPSCVLFAGIALVVHGFVALLGTLLWKRVFHSNFSLADVLVASNAAIGGPATAATFCGTIEMDNDQKKRGLTIAATIWGVVGYAIGTTIGIAFFRFLNSRFVH